MQCPSPYHKGLVERKQLLRKYLGNRISGRLRYANLTPPQRSIQFALAIYQDGVEVGRFNPTAACPFCWSVMLSAMGYSPRDLALVAPAQAERVLGSSYKWVSACLEDKRVRKRTGVLERDIRIAQQAALEVLRQLGIIKEAENQP